MDENKNNPNTAPNLNETQTPAPVPVLPPVQNIQENPPQESKPSKWRYFFIILGILQVLGVAFFFLVLLWAIQQANAGVSGTEFIGLALYTTVMPALAIIALINLVGLPVFIMRNKPHGKGLVFGVISVLISLIVFAYGAYSVYIARVELPRQTEEFDAQLRQDLEQREQGFAADNNNPEISKEEAIRLLNDCKLKGFYYTNEANLEHGTSPATSETGIVLTKIDGKPYRISIADRLIDELVPIARKAQKTCIDPQFWHDGRYEQYKDGDWYFKGEVVNSTQ